MTKEKWSLNDGTEIEIETGSPYPDGFSEDDVDHSWYADDFLQFITMILWDAYPSLRPLISRAKEACWKAWRVRAKEERGCHDLPDTILKPPGMKHPYRLVVGFYVRDLRENLERLLNGLFDGSFHEVDQDND